MEKFFIYLTLLISLFSCTEKEKASAVVMKTLSYPSASAVEYVNGKLYIMGDDATQMLVLDTNFYVVDSIKLFDYPEKRIPKSIKHDIESMLLSTKDSNELILISSGSISPYRDSIWIVDIKSKKKESKALTYYYKAAKSKGIKELNIEGAVMTKDEFIVANRGHLGWPENHLIISPWFLPEAATMGVIPIRYSSDSSTFQGVSSLTYSNLNDALIMTASTEQTASTTEDGAIGKSYIWIITKFSNLILTPEQALNPEFKPDIIIDLEKIDPIFKGHKIESATILYESKESLRVVLVADNDNGSSSILKLTIKLN